MDKLTNFIQIVEEAIEKNAYKKQPQSLYAPINYTLALGGKRIRRHYFYWLTIYLMVNPKKLSMRHWR